MLKLIPALACVSLLVMCTGSAHAATTVGQTFTPIVNSAFGNPDTEIQVQAPAPPAPQYDMPSGGVITSWSHQAAAGNPESLRLKIVRAVTSNSYRVTGHSQLQLLVPDSLNTFPTRITVQPGDTLGLHTPQAIEVSLRTPGYGVASLEGTEPGIGVTQTFPNFYSPIQLDVSAVLEPDADNDGFGDETQDLCPGNPAEHGDCTPPETSLTRTPKKKSTNKQATIGFSSNEPGSSFECSLDGKEFAGCVAPRIFRVGYGKHLFKVRAVDQAGNLDDTPARHAWTVKKKKRNGR